MVYLGCISQSQFIRDKKTGKTIPKSPQPFWIWKKVVNFNNNLNPKVVIEERIYQDKPYKVVRDDLLPAGSKQRVMQDIFKSHPGGLIYPGPANGFAQVALALGAKEFNSKVVILIPKMRPLTAQTILAAQLGAEIIEFEGDNAKLANMRTAAEKIINKDNNNNKIKLYMPKLGFAGDEFKNAFISALKESLDLDRAGVYSFWVVGGSGTLALTLLDMFQNSKVNVVQVGKQIDWYFKDNLWAKLYIANEGFYEAAKDPPPYPSVSNYDAKVWQFAKKAIIEQNETPTIIWNVAGEAKIF